MSRPKILRPHITIRRADGTAFQISRDELDHHARHALVERVRRMKLHEEIGTFGIVTAICGLVWMLGKCGPTLFPGLFL